MQILALILNILSAYEAIWKNTIIEVPVGSSISQYEDLPTASLCTNGHEIARAVKYKKGTHTYKPSMINTSTVSQRSIEYTVIFENGASSKKNIIFKIVDNIPPKFNGIIADIKMPVKAKLLTEKEILSKISYNDNYYKKEDLNLKLEGLNLVNPLIPATYKLKLILSDPSGNFATRELNYKIYATDKPVIRQIKSLDIPLGQKFNYADYFQITDSYDTNLHIDVRLNGLNVNKIGITRIQIIAINSGKLSAYLEAMINVIDNIAPTLSIESNKIIEVNNKVDLKNFIVEASDNYDKLEKKHVKIIENINFSKLGKYEVTYILEDKSKNKTEKKLILEIKDSIKPEIIQTQDIIIDVFSQKIAWNNYFEIKDNYDKKDDLIIKYDATNINFKKIGKYELEVSVTDSSKNKKVGTYEVNIIDNGNPVIRQIKDIIITDFKVKNIDFYRSFFEIKDNYDDIKDISIELKENIDFDKIAKIPVTFIFTDSSKNQVFFETHINIIDNIAPNLVIESNKIINVGSIVDLRSYIIDVSDNYYMLNKDDVTLITNINFNELGKYDVLYKLKDGSNNETIKKLVVEIKDLEKPEIKLIHEIKIDVFSININWNKYFEFKDNYDELDDLIIKYDATNINLKKIGTYELIVSVTDNNKNKKTSSYEIIIVDTMAPIVKQINEIVINDFTKKDISFFRKHFDIEDNYDDIKDIKMEIKDEIDYHKIGKILTTFIFSDQSKNESFIDAEIYLIDDKKPTIFLIQNEYKHFLGQEKVDLMSLIADYGDNYTRKDDLKIMIKETINYEKIGKYDVLYSVIDEMLNETQEKLTFYIDRRKEITANVSNLTIQKDEKWKVLDGIEFDNNVSRYEYFPKIVETDKLGKVEVKYIAYDERGNYEEFYQTINVVSNQRNDQFDYKPQIIITGIGIVLLSLVIAQPYFKKKQTNIYD